MSSSTSRGGVPTSDGEPARGLWGCTIVGQGRMGTALAGALRRAGLEVIGPLGRGATGSGAPLVVLCVPDREIANAAALIEGGSVVAHVSASSGLSVLAPHESASVHPLLSVAGDGADFRGASCAVDGSTPRALSLVIELAQVLGMRPMRVAPEQRALYHAAASAAANYSVTVLGIAERLARRAGIDREALVPLVRSTLANWESLGAQAALTGPIARGDIMTAAAQRDAVGAAEPALLAVWDALAKETAILAAQAARAR